jgi:hypothetical protein
MVSNRLAVVAKLRNEGIEQGEAPGGEFEQWPAVARLDEGGEHACRGLSGTHARLAIVDNLNRRSAARQLVRDRAADHACADDNDVARGGHA